MSQENFNPYEMIDAYLDGQLPAGQRNAFRRLLETDMALAAMVKSQMAIDAALRRMYVPPAGIALPHRAPSKMKLNWRNTSWVKVTAAAASIVIGFGMLVHAYREEFPTIVTAPPRPSIEAVYKAEVQHGFQAGWKCDNDKQFADTFQSRLGQPLNMKHPPADVEAMGLSYRGCISDNTTFMLAKVQGADVAVFVDRAECDCQQTLPQGSALHLFTRNVGGLVLYEVTPLNQPRLLDLFYQPTAAEQQPTTKKWN